MAILARRSLPVALVLSLLAVWYLSAQPTPLTGPVLVRGYIAVRPLARANPDRPVRTDSSDLYVPGVKVWLRDPSTGATSLQVDTDLSGRFTLKGPARQRLVVCWSAAGFVSACPKVISTTDKPIHVSRLYASPQRVRDMTVLFGAVRMADGSLPRLLQPLAGINAYATVTLRDQGGRRLARAYVNNFGEYILPQVPSRATRITLEARLDGGLHSRSILRQANLVSAPAHRVDFSIQNSRPRLNPLIPLDAAGARIKTATPGSTITLRAEVKDPDGDPLTYRWWPASGSGSVSSASGNSTAWTIPSADAMYTAYLMVTDGKGGYAQSEVTVRADTKGVLFSGYVRGSDVPHISGAAVDVNGTTTATGITGFFSLRVPDAKRFVLNIDKPGYALVSKIYDGPVTGGEWIMTRATVTRIDPTRDNEVVNTRRPADCPGPMALRLNWKDFPHLATPQFQDGKGNVVREKAKLEVPLPQRFERRRECGPGIRVRLSANSLQDANGNLPVGQVDVDTSTIDLASPWQMPGDYSVRTPSGDIRVMQSWGAGTVEIRSGSTRFNLRPGATAQVTIPVDPLQLSSSAPPPPTIPLLSYDQVTGLWIDEGNVATLTGNVYVGTVKHFSAINTDLVKTNQSCVRVLSPTLGTTYDLEITVPAGSPAGAAPILLNRFVDNGPTQEHVVYNLPSNVNIVLVPIRRPPLDPTPYGTFVVNTGLPQVPTNPNLPAGPPYVACSTTVTLSELSVPELPVTGEFLHGLYSFEASNLFELSTSNPALATALDTATANYYTQIDPRGKRLNLTGFRTTNGFGGPTEIRAVFANAGDLGFGRDMHCNKQVASDGLEDIACYVTNYGTIVTDDVQDAADAVSQSNPVATVAMEYSRIESPPSGPVEFDDPQRTVKFYVYNAAGTALLRSADLDTGGVGDPRPRPIPQLCMVCHNGEYPNITAPGTAPTFASRNDVKLGSRFLPFDLRYYTFTAAPFDKASQQPAFRQLNEQMVRNTPPDATAIAEVVNLMYAGGPTQDENFVAAGFNLAPIHQNFYRSTVAPTCRTCHAANIFPQLEFSQSSQITDILGSIEQRVCVEHVMPHAKRTHDIFWTSTGPHMPAQLQVYGDTFGSAANGWNGTRCGQFTGAGAPPSYYNTVIQPIWDGIGTGTIACTACHPSAGGLGLASGVGFTSYDNIVDVNSTQASTMKRIKPNDIANSYLLHKLLGTHGSVGGTGVRMPQGCPGSRPCLLPVDITKIQDWINAGAPFN